MNFFTSDPHLGHLNILKLADRPFASVEEMNEALISNYNNVVNPGDTCYFMGDVVMGKRYDNLKMISRLNGTKILVCGNHDYPFEKQTDYWKKVYEDAGFTQVHLEHLVVDCPDFHNVGGSIRLHHYPVKEAPVQDHIDSEVRYAELRLPSDGLLHLSGHTHEKNHIAGPRNIHVGVDASRWNYSPVSLTQIEEVCREEGWTW